MQISRQTASVLSLLLLGTVSALLEYSSCQATETATEQKIIAKVNGVPILSNELPALKESRISQYRQLGSKIPLDALKKQFQRKDLDRLIDEELLAQAGAASGVQDETEQRLKKRLDSFEKPDEKKKMAGAVPDREKLRKEIQRELYLEKTGGLSIRTDEQELRRFYDSNLKSFTEPLSIKVRHILIQVPLGAPKNIEGEARQKAEDVLKKLKSGNDFALLAQQYSDCSTKSAGGDLGLIRQGYMPKDFDAVAFALKPGETSSVVKSRYGFHIIRVEEFVPEKVTAFKDVKEYISGYLQKGLQQRKLDELLDKLRKTAKIEILFD